FLFFFFFFQAEDGIRDRTVTGVQTCALPIFGEELVNLFWRRRQTNEVERDAADQRFFESFGGKVEAFFLEPREEKAVNRIADERSEERRVGKECRSGWWTYE